MDKHNKNKHRSRSRMILAGVATAAAGVAVFFSGGHTALLETAPEATPWAAPGSSSSTSTDAELPNTINVFGQDAVKKAPFDDPINSDWHRMLFRQSSEMKHPAEKKAYFNFMKQFDDLKKQFHAAGGKSPESIDAIVKEVNQRVSDQIEDHPSFINDYKSPVETIDKLKGSSQDKAVLMEAIMQHIGFSGNRELVARFNSQGDASKDADVVYLLINDAPEGTPSHWVVAGKLSEQAALIDARNQQREAFFTVDQSSPSAIPSGVKFNVGLS